MGSAARDGNDYRSKRLKEMNWTLAFIHELCLALWVGGLFALDAEAPIRLKTPGVTPEQATAIGSRVFRLFRYLQVLLGLVLIAVTYLIMRRRTDAAFWIRVELCCLAVMLAITVFQVVYLGPSVERARIAKYSNIRFDERRFHVLHMSYLILDGVKLLLGLFVLGLVAFYSGVTLNR
jgi:hypothetical protein